MTMNEMSPADIQACCGNNSNNGWGAGNFGDWIILFLIFGMFGFGGWGGGFGGFGGGANNPGLQGLATRADINEGFALNNITSGITAIQQGICDSTYALTNNINNGFHGVDNAICNLGNQIQQGFNTTNIALMQGQHALSTQLAQCCCDNREAIAGVRYDMAAQACDTRNTIQNSTRDIIDNQNANSRAILDFLTQDKIATLTAENQSLKFQASQTAQNAFITANQDAQTATLLRRLGADCPTPAYVVQPPTPVTFPTNCCGQVQFGGAYGGNCGGCAA